MLSVWCRADKVSRVEFNVSCLNENMAGLTDRQYLCCRDWICRTDRSGHNTTCFSCRNSSTYQNHCHRLSCLSTRHENAAKIIRTSSRYIKSKTNKQKAATATKKQTKNKTEANTKQSKTKQQQQQLLWELQRPAVCIIVFGKDYGTGLTSFRFLLFSARITRQVHGPSICIVAVSRDFRTASSSCCLYCFQQRLLDRMNVLCAVLFSGFRDKNKRPV